MSNVDFETVAKQEVARLEKLHPTPEDIPGCMGMLDSFLSCNVVGQQIKALYRFGEMSACGEKLEEFKFCMSLKSMEADEKRDAWIRRRAEWWANRRIKMSSENVWDIRTEPLTNWPPSSLVGQMDSQSAHTIS